MGSDTDGSVAERRGTPSRAPATWIPIVAVAGLALLVRIAPYLAPGQILAVREYDDGVMLGGAIALLSGRAPYGDFVYMHPPGSLLGLLPAATTAGVWGEPLAMAASRVAMVLVGVTCTVLIGMLLQRWGWFAVVAGAGAYALWPVAVGTEQTILLEPSLNLGLLVALLLLQRWGARAAVGAGVAIGLATTVKVWAVVDIVVIAALVVAAYGLRKLLHFLIGAGSAILLVCLPFFVAAPADMWDQVVVAQLSRAGTPATLFDRAGTYSLVGGIHAVDLLIPPVAWFVMLAALIALGCVPLGRALRQRRPLRSWPQQAWWAVILLVHTLVLATSSGFFYHYAAWLLAPLCLTVGHALGSAPGAVRRWTLPVVITGLSVVLVADLTGAVRHPNPNVGGTSELAEWAQTRTCVWGGASQLIAADALRGNLGSGCAFDIDAFGAFLVYDRDVSRVTDEAGASALWRERQRSFIAGADGVLTPAPGDAPAWLSESDVRGTMDLFERVANLGGIGVWNRTDG